MTSKTLRLSRFSHRFEHPSGACCLYHKLTQRKVYGREVLKALHDEFQRPSIVDDVVNRLSARFPGKTLADAIYDMEDIGILVENENADLDTYLHLLHAGTQLYQIRHTYFVPVSDCNLRCAYCFVEDEDRGGFPTGRMTSDVARKSLDIFAKLTENADKISLTFYGGEPLMNPNVVHESMHYIRKLERDGRFKKPVDVTLLTNGTLITDKTVETVLATKTNVAISIDGPRHIHDAARINTRNKGTFDGAVRGFKAMQAAGVNPGVSCTLTRHNIDLIEDVVDFIVKELSPPGIGFNILLPRARTGNPLDVDHDYAAKQLILAFKRLREHGVYEDRIMRRVIPFTETQFHFKDCMGVGGQVVFTPQGIIGPCQAYLGIDKFFPLNVDALHDRLSSINSENIYEEPLFREWRYRFPLNMKGCYDCFAIAVCGGGCPYASEVNHGSIWSIDERICYQAKTTLEWMIWDTYEHMIQAEAHSEISTNERTLVTLGSS